MKTLRLHHIGLIVENIDNAVEHYRLLHPNATTSPRYVVHSQGVSVLFFQVSKDLCFEFIEETRHPSAITTFKKKGINFYHVGYKSSEFDNTIKELEESGYKIFDTIISEAYQHKRVRFVLSPDLHWLEIIEE